MALPPIVPFASAWLAQRAIRRKNPSQPTPLAVRVVGTAIGVASALMIAGTVSQYRLAHTTVDPRKPHTSSALITTGSHRVTRNPIYVGMVGLLSAHALRHGSLRALLPIAGFVAAVTPQIEAEEEALVDRFGSAYGKYVARVPRWLR